MGNQSKDSNASSQAKNEDRAKTVDGVKNPAGQQGAPHDAYTTPQVIDRDQLQKPEYELTDRGTLEVHRDRPNHIYENQMTQQAQENTVEVFNGTRNQDGTLKENNPNHPDNQPEDPDKV